MNKAELISAINDAKLKGVSVDENSFTVPILDAIYEGIQAKETIQKLTEEVEDLKTELKDQEEIIEGLNAKIAELSNQAKTGKPVINFKGKDYNLATKRFKIEGSVFTEADIRENRDKITERLLKIPGQSILIPITK